MVFHTFGGDLLEDCDLDPLQASQNEENAQPVESSPEETGLDSFPADLENLLQSLPPTILPVFEVFWQIFKRRDKLIQSQLNNINTLLETVTQKAALNALLLEYKVGVSTFIQSS